MARKFIVITLEHLKSTGVFIGTSEAKRTLPVLPVCPVSKHIFFFALITNF
jgi:hypothetical protein